jgi:hypothetical protein
MWMEFMSVLKDTFEFESVQSFKIPSRRSYKFSKLDCKSSNNRIHRSRIYSSFITLVMDSSICKIECTGQRFFGEQVCR